MNYYTELLTNTQNYELYTQNYGNHHNQCTNLHKTQYMK